MEYDFCSVCGNNTRYEYDPFDHTTKEVDLEMTLISGSVVCHDCWKKTNRTLGEII